MINIKTDSRKVVGGDTFVAIKGHTVDGHDFIEKAIENGASRIVCEHGSYGVETVVVPSSNEWLCEHLKENYSSNFDGMKIVGVTGTNGKTTTCFLLSNAFKLLGIKSAYVGTIGFYIDGEKIMDLPNTTPEIIEIYNILDKCREEGVEYVSMEVSSHALSLDRLCGISFDAALFTNLTKDHLDFHGTFENYADAKRLLFTKLKNEKVALINVDADFNEVMFVDGNRNRTYGFGESDYFITDFVTGSAGSDITLCVDGSAYNFKSELSGKYNVYNVVSVVSILNELGFDLEKVLGVIPLLKAPAGRMEKVYYGTNTIIVDYAHTPDAMINVINAAKEFAKGKVICLVGCGGDRDKTKRPEMANIATSLCDYAILTSDNPRTEDPDLILDDMVNGLENKNYTRIVDREEAIKAGIDMLNDNDMLLLLGKGHEDYQVIGHEKVHMDDKEISINYIRELENKNV